MNVHPPARRTAGLSLSVGSASFGVRCLLATVFGVAALLCLAAAAAIGALGPLAARAVAVLVITPLGCIGVIGAVYTLSPFSRFGLWLDVFVGNLTWARAALVFAGFWTIGVAMIALLYGFARMAMPLPILRLSFICAA